MRLPSRQTVCLSAILLIAVCSTLAWLLSTRINEKNFNRIKDGMSVAEVRAILGDDDESHGGVILSPDGHWLQDVEWRKGRNSIRVFFDNDKARNKHGRFASAWETLDYYAEAARRSAGLTRD
jgi:hypothetical protein